MEERLADCDGRVEDKEAPGLAELEDAAPRWEAQGPMEHGGMVPASVGTR